MRAVLHPSRLITLEVSSTATAICTAATQRVGRPETVLSLLLAGCIALGAGLAELTMPALFGLAPTELSRTQTLLRALNSADATRPGIVVLGSSIVMSGIDGRQLASDLRSTRPVWNLGSTGQQPAEILLLADALPASVSTVVAGISIDDLRSGGYDPLTLTKYCVYELNGYRPSPAVRDLAQGLPSMGLAPLFALNRWQVTAAGRWVFRSSADLVARGLIRRDLDLARARDDLYHPIPYSRRMTPEEIATNVRLSYAPRTVFLPAPDSSRMLLGMRDILRRRGKRLVLLILPEHPARGRLSTAGFYRAFDSWLTVFRRESGIDVLDCHDVLAAEDFVDHIHPGFNGAARLTGELSRHLRTNPL